MLRSSRRHLQQAGESYFEHMRFALTVAALTIGAGLGCLIHALVPAFCERTCSRTVDALQHLFADRRRIGEVQRQGEGVLVFVGLLALGGILMVMLFAAGGATPATLAITGMLLALPAAYLLTDRELAGPPN